MHKTIQQDVIMLEMKVELLLKAKHYTYVYTRSCNQVSLINYVITLDALVKQRQKLLVHVDL
jgi:hypothetical protein